MTFSVAVKDAPPGKAGSKGEVSVNIPNHLTAVSGSFTGQGTSSTDGNKVTWSGVTFQEGGELAFSLRARVDDNAPCNHVATAVASVNGLGSTQVQVRVHCPGGEPAAESPQQGPGPGSGSNAQPARFSVEKTASFEGQKLERIEAQHLGKQITYNILIRRNGEVPQGRMRIVEDMSQMCGSLESLRNTVEIQNQSGTRLRVGEQVQINDNCQITILGDAKDIVGDQFHFKVRLRPSLEAVSAPTLNNRVTAALLSGSGTQVIEQESAGSLLGLAVATDILPAAARSAPAGAVAPVQVPAGGGSGSARPAAVPVTVTAPAPQSSPAPASVTTPGGFEGAPGEMATGADDVGGGTGMVPAIAAGEVGGATGMAPAITAGQVGGAFAVAPAPAALPSAGGPAIPTGAGLAGAGLMAFGWLVRRRR